MKKIILFILLINVSIAQVWLLDSTFFYEYRGVIGDFELISIEVVHNRNEVGVPVEIRYYTTSLNRLSKRDTIFLNNNLKVKMLSQLFVNNSWKDTNLTLFNWNNDKLIAKTLFVMKNNNWQIESRDTHQYNSQNLITKTIKEYYLNGNLYYYDVNTFSYDASGNLIEKLEISNCSPNTNICGDTMKTTYSYKNGLVDSLTIFRIFNGQAYVVASKAYKYDNNKLIETITYWYQYGQFEPKYRRSFLYDNNGNLIRRITQQYFSQLNEYVNVAMDTFEYNGNNLLIRETLYVWISTGNKWTPSSRYEYKYVQYPSNISYKLEANIKVFPNPTKRLLFIEGLNAPINFVNIYSYDGKLIKEATPVYNNIIDVSNLSAGYYIMVINGRYSVKFIKN